MHQKMMARLVCRHDMEANVTLHWFVHPRWFDELGGWIKSENVRYYVEWAELAFKHFGRTVSRHALSQAVQSTWNHSTSDTWLMGICQHAVPATQHHLQCDI